MIFVNDKSKDFKIAEMEFFFWSFLSVQCYLHILSSIMHIPRFNAKEYKFKCRDNIVFKMGPKLPQQTQTEEFSYNLLKTENTRAEN